LTPSGLYAGESFQFSLDKDRLMNTAAKIVKGMFYHVAGYPLPPDYGARAVPLEDFIEGLSGLPATTQRLYRRLCKQPEVQIGEGVFSYRFFPPDEDVNTSFWIFMFYRSIGFMGVTGKTATLEAEYPT
jgi:hypothetical protein